MRRKYFWLNANSKQWSFTNLCPGESEGFSVFNSSGNRRFNPKAYASVREGDIVLGFQGNPTGKIFTIGKITQVPRDISDQSAEITFTKLIDLQNGVSKDELEQHGLAGIQPITARSGTFFLLEDDEYYSILEIIRDKNPHILESDILGNNLTLAEKIENLDVQTAVEYAKETDTYYFGGRLFEYRNYSEDEFKRIIGYKKLFSIMNFDSDSSLILVNFHDNGFMTGEDKNTFIFTRDFEYNCTIDWKPQLLDAALYKYVHVFDEIEDGVFKYLGPAALKLKETILVAEPDEEYKTWRYRFVIEGNLVYDNHVEMTPDKPAYNVKDIEKNIPDGLKGYDREAVIKSRVNQSGFRQNLIKKYGKCCLCGVESPELLLASHIKPWKDSNEDEKGATCNGLLLCPNHDKLFDRGLISFSDDGTILISEKLTKNEQMFMNVNDGMKIQVEPDMKKFLAFHRENCFKK